MIRQKSLFFTVLTVIFLFFNLQLFAQVSDEDEVQNLEEEAQEQENKPSEVNASLQKNFIILEPERIHNLNPQTTSYTTDSQVLTGLYEGLFSYNPVTLEPQYAIAQNYKTSRDKKRITFTLRQDAYFSNGEKITAQSVKDSWIQLLATPEAPYASLLDIIRGAEAFRTGNGSEEKVGIKVISENQLSVYLNSPANYLPRVLCLSSFAIVHRNPTVYSGPFMLEDQEPGILILKKNPYYWDYNNTYLEQITFVQSDNLDENAFLYNTGAVDWIMSGNVTSDKLLNRNSLQLSGQFGTSYYFFKNSCKKSAAEKEKFNPWDYEEFRSAILEAFPWEEMRQNAFVPATTFVYPLSGYPAVEGYDYTDVTEGVEKMKAARAKYNLPEDEPLQLTFEITDYTLADDKIDFLHDALLPLGVELVIKKVPVNTYLSGVSKSDSDLFAYTWIGDFADPLAFLTLFQSNSTLNDSGWKSEEFDSLLLQAAEASDADRYVLLAKAETLLLDSGMVIPLYHPVSFNVVDLTEVGGWSVNAFDIHPLKYLYKKETKVSLPNMVMLK